jgi:sterol desaturase/sphingolipid hydroxylase (fatty acid hydroxylase superfamily)
MEMTHTKIAIAIVYFGFAGLELLLGRLALKEGASRRDLIIDLASATAVPLVILPTVLVLAPMLADWAFPGSEGWLAHWPWWAMFGVLLIADDLTQYMWHRLSHTSWLYPLHRAHHSAEYMSVSIVYRNNLVYYALMPGLWLSGVLIHWGFGGVYVVYIAVKMTVIIGAHSSVPWDEPLYRNAVTSRIMWVVERVISTPATHAAHHGLHLSDGVTHYKGNYGNLLFLWDMIFGTAKITRKRPAGYGIEALAPVPWVRELIWPVSARPETETPLPTVEKASSLAPGDTGGSESIQV